MDQILNFFDFLVVVQLIHILTRTKISCTTIIAKPCPSPANVQREYSPFQLANRDNRIRQLEEAVKKMELGNEVNGSSTKH